MLGCWCHALCHGNVSWHFGLCGGPVNPSHCTPCLLLHTGTPLSTLCLLPKAHLFLPGTGLSHTRHKLSLLKQNACCARISWNPFPKDLSVQVQQVKPTPLQSCPALFACWEASRAAAGWEASCAVSRVPAWGCCSLKSDLNLSAPILPSTAVGREGFVFQSSRWAEAFLTWYLYSSSSLVSEYETLRAVELQ